MSRSAVRSVASPAVRQVMALVLALALGVTAAVHAQLLEPVSPSTPQQLVQIETGRIVLITTPDEREQAEALAAVAEKLLSKLEQDFRQRTRAPITVVLLPAQVPESLRDLDRAGPEWAAGFILSDRRLAALRLDRTHSYPFDSLEMVLAHELSHQILHDKVGHNVPRWFDEAVSTLVGRRRGARDLLVFASTSVLGRVPSLQGLDRGFHGSESMARQAYAASLEFLSWAERRHGPTLVPDILDALATRLSSPPLLLDARTPFEAAWQEVSGEPLLISEQRWHRSLRFSRWIPILLTSNALWVMMAVLVFVAALSRRRQNQEQKRRWEEEELAQAQLVDAAVDPSDEFESARLGPFMGEQSPGPGEGEWNDPTEVTDASEGPGASDDDQLVN